jgi:tetratricopeptide (TPR) repeat protein
MMSNAGGAMTIHDEYLQQGIAAYKAGRKAEARKLFWQVLEADPKNERAWLWLSGTVETEQERYACLEKVLDINPNNETARRGLEHLRAEAPPTVSIIMPQSELRTMSPPDAGPRAPRAVSSPSPTLPQSPGPSQPIAAKGKNDVSPLTFWLLAIGMVLAFLCIAAILLYQLVGPGFQLGGAQPPASYDEITRVIYENVAAHNAEDIERYIATMHTKSPNYADLRQNLQEVYSTYDLRADVSGVQVIKASRNEARVSFVLVTRKIRGPAFRDNRVEGVFVLRKEDDRWKLYNQEIDNVEYLE